MDNFEWAAGYAEKFGLHYINFTDPARPRVPKDSSLYYGQIIADNGFPDLNPATSTEVILEGTTGIKTGNEDATEEVATTASMSINSNGAHKNDKDVKGSEDEQNDPKKSLENKDKKETKVKALKQETSDSGVVRGCFWSIVFSLFVWGLMFLN